ncbi:hypothetical protein [Vreelandella lionensis]|uniref:hypothetical protein n=1 Tax=Vreelandella lionensis TaxID=1144478 RepID=UPI001374750C|nr:hypothetical protein [Halomonas lionensis]
MRGFEMDAKPQRKRRRHACGCYVFLRFIFIPSIPISTYSQSENRLIAIDPPPATIKATIVDVATPADGANAATAPAPTGPDVTTRGIAAIIPPTAAGPQDFASFTAFSFLTRASLCVTIS